MSLSPHIAVLLMSLCSILAGSAQMVSSSTNGVVKQPAMPRVVAPTQRGVVPKEAPRAGSGMVKYKEPRSLYTNTSSPGVYPWKKNITVTVFWVGETPTANNPVPNHKSSWDTAWQENFGGFDDPEPTNRTQDFHRQEFRPRHFIPRQNPFYVALPYNDCISSREHKPEAARVIPWFRRDMVKPGQSVCKGKWLQIFYKGKYCFAQWEDCGPFTTEDWSYVFGSSDPKNTHNRAAGLDISPAVRDYLGVKSGEKVHWRFVDFNRIPKGPWSKFGDNNPFVKRQPSPDEQRRMEQMNRYIKLRNDTLLRNRSNVAAAEKK